MSAASGEQSAGRNTTLTRAASASCSPGGKFKSHQVNTTDWNDPGKAEEWRAQWARYATAMQKEYCNLRGKIAAIGRQIDQMDERLPMWKQYSENKVFHRRLAALKPRVREKFQDAHSVELALYDAAVRYLNELKSVRRENHPEALAGRGGTPHRPRQHPVSANESYAHGYSDRGENLPDRRQGDDPFQRHQSGNHERQDQADAPE